jgi:hypothetical protein
MVALFGSRLTMNLMPNSVISKSYTLETFSPTRPSFLSYLAILPYGDARALFTYKEAKRS